MTFNEKRIMIAACVSYQKKKTSEAERLRKNGSTIGLVPSCDRFHVVDTEALEPERNI